MLLAFEAHLEQELALSKYKKQHLIALEPQQPRCHPCCEASCRQSHPSHLRCSASSSSGSTLMLPARTLTSDRLMTLDGV